MTVKKKKKPIMSQVTIIETPLLGGQSGPDVVESYSQQTELCHKA